MYLWMVLVFVADRVTKALAVQGLSLGESLPVIEDVLHLTYVQNTGAAFGILRGRFLFFVVANAVLFAGILWWHYFSGEAHLMSRPAAGMILGGALGNLVDRMAWGYVVDFIDLRVWPVFNVADIGLVVGSVLLAVHLWRVSAKEEQDRRTAAD